MFFIIPDFNVGGVETAIINLAQRLYKDYDLFFFYKQITTIEFAKELAKYGICRNVSVPQEDMQADFLIFCSMWLAKDTEIAFVKAKKKILWFHAMVPRGGNKFYDLRFMKNIDYVVGVSDAAVKSIPYYLYKNKMINKIKKINNIVNTKEIIEKSKEEVKLDLAPDLNICTVARLSHEKGWHRVRILCKELEKLNINFKWFIVGYGYFEDQVARIHNLLDDIPEIVWYGGTDNPFPIVKQMDYSALLSDYESWGMVLTEAKILRVSVIASDFPAAKEQIEDNKNGFILPLKVYSSYDKVAKQLVNKKQEFKESLKDFDYETINKESIKKWKEIFDKED